MFEDSDEELEFWSNVPEGRFDRFSLRRQQAKAAKQQRTTRPVGGRSHEDTQSIPVVAAPTQRVKDATEHVDPLLRRVGTMAVVVALLIPVALALRSGTDPGPNATSQPQVSTLSTGSSDSTLGIADSAAPPEAANTVLADAAPPATIDIDALPEAVPVNTVAPKAATPKTPVTTTAARPAPVATSTSNQARVERTQTSRPVCAKTYTVKSGDAWITIAKKAAVSIKELLKANGATAKTPIYPGRDICLPANATTPTSATSAATPATTAKPAQKSATPAPKSTTTTVPARTYSRAEVTQIIREVWPDDLEDEAIRIATRESNLVPSVKNYCCYGLFQIFYNVHKGWLAQMGITSGSQLWDPRANALAAFVLYQRSNSFSPWN